MTSFIVKSFIVWGLPSPSPCNGFSKRKSTSNPIAENVCPWALFIVIAKQRRKGNCKRLNWNGISAVDGISGIRGMKATFPEAGPCSMITSITFAWHALTRHQVPLVMLGGSKDLRTITGHPILRVSLCGGMPAILTEFKNSTGKCIASSTVWVESNDL